MKRSIGVLGGAVVALLAVQIASASGGTSTVVGPSGASYSMTVTCATKSATASVNIATASAFSTFEILADNGVKGGLTYFNGGVPAVSGPQNLIASDFVAAASSAYSLSESNLAGTTTALLPPVSTTDCPTYAGVGAQFVPLNPSRILDTRPATAKNYSGPKPLAGAQVDLRVTDQQTIPTNAVAVALNVTMTNTTAPGFLQVFPSGVGTVGSSSNLNADAAEQTIANLVIAPVGNDGKITFYTSAGSHILADVSGYFINVPGAVNDGRYTPLPAAKRILNTRDTAKPNGRSITTINPVNLAPLPAGQVGAVALNVTVTEPADPGYVQLAPSGSLIPGSNSNVNVTRSGQTIPNLVIVAVSATGELDIYTLSSAHLIVDVLGWFSNASAPPATSGLYFPVVPERVLDTRAPSAVNYRAELGNGIDVGQPPAATQTKIYFDGLPAAGVGAVLLNLTAASSAGAGFLQAGPANDLTPGSSSNVNFERAGQTIPNAAIVGVSFDNGVAIFNSTAATIIADISGFFRL